MNAQPRPGWADLPPVVRARITENLGGRVIAWTSYDHGMMPGYAMHLQTTEGQAYVKAYHSPDPLTNHGFRSEAEVTAHLPEGAPAPRLLWLIDEEFEGSGSWTVAAYSMRLLRRPADPWDADDIASAVRLARRISETRAPAHEPFRDVATYFQGDVWARVAEEYPDGPPNFTPWIAERYALLDSLAVQVGDATRGDRLVHGTLRRDTVLLDPRPGGSDGLVVDWIHGVRGAPFLDQVMLLPSLQIEGGPPPERVLERHPFPAGTAPDAVNACLAAIAGYLVHQSSQPAPPGLPHHRPAQRSHAHVCVDWLRRRLGG